MQRRASLLVDQESGCPFRIRHLDDVIDSDTTDLYRKEKERSLRYNHLNAEQYDVVDKLIRGGIRPEFVPCQKPKVVRMFVCSSGPDFESEINYLFENVYPLLRQYCRDNHGIDFQLADMYWGNPSLPSTDPHKMATVYEELRHCQEISMGPNFIAFVGQKYGTFHLPLTVLASDMEEIKDALLESGSDDTLLNKWYEKDLNVAPNIYRLKKPRSEDGQDLDEDYQEIIKLLQSGSTKSENITSVQCSTSDFENLLQSGMLRLSREERDKNCIVYMRNIRNIDERLNAKNAGNFVDLEDGNSKRDIDKTNKINVLRGFVEKCVTSSNIVQSEIELNGCTLDEQQSGQYISNIGKHFYSTVVRLVNEQIERENKLCEDPLIHELSLHWNYAKQSYSPFIGREEVLNAIKGYLLSDTDQPLVLCSESGTGKSTLIAKAANDINEAVINSDLSMPTAVVVRFIGETGHCEDVQPLLYHLCHQLAFITGRYRQDIPSDYLALKNYFIDLIQRGEYGGMIVILIDALNKLSTTDNGHKLDWLPSRIASNVKIIVTVDSDDEEIMKRLENKVDEGIIAMPEFSPNECENTLKALMSGNKQSVNYNQWKRIQLSFSSCSTPLFSRLVYAEISQWSSFDDISTNMIEHSTDDFIKRIFVSLEQKHGSNLVRRILGYLTAAKNGLSELEMEDILSLDDKLLNSIFVNNNEYPHIRRIPHIHWSCLRQELQPYLCCNQSDGIATFRWRYRRFAQLAEERYCQESISTLYSNMADYYIGTWSGTIRKPFKHPTVLMAKYKLVERDGECCRFVPTQPLSFGENMVCNSRKLSQLPYLLVQSERFDDLKSDVLCNYEWIASKLRITSIQQVIADFEMYEDREIKLVGDALRMSKSAISVDRNALGMELTGRLLPHIYKYPSIKELIRQCDLDAQRCCPLVANCQIYSAPGGPLQYECDIGANVNCSVDIDVFTSPDGILLTAKPFYSTRLRVWELANGDERPDIMLPLGDVKPTKDGRYINIFVDDRSIKTYRSNCGVLHGEVEFGHGKISQVKVSNKYIAFTQYKGAGPCVVDIERSEILHKFKYHTHAVAITEDEKYVAFNAERNILLYELPVMQRKCVATASDVAHEILFVNDIPKCFVLTKTKIVESISFDVINRKFKCKGILTDMNAKKCVLSNLRQLLIVQCDKILHVIDTVTDKVRTRFQKLPAGVFVDSNSTFSGAGFTPDDSMIVATRYTYLIVWDAETCAPIRVLQTAVSPMVQLFTSDSVNKVVTLLKNNSFQVWDLENLDRDTEHSAEVHQGAVQTLAVSSAADYIMSTDDKTPDAKLVCLSTGDVMDTLQHSENSGDRLTEVLMSPDGLYAATRAKLEHTNSLSYMTFEPLTDDVMWELETASKVFHAISNRYIVFSPQSGTAAFVTCAFYNSCDWSENIYNVFIVYPETSTNYTIDFPYHTEFVAPPKIVYKGGNNYFAAIVQTCKKTFDNNTKKEQSRWTEVRLLVQKITPNQNPSDQVLLRVQNLVDDVDDTDEFLDLIPVFDGNVIAVYAKDIDMYEFVTDKGIIPPKCTRKGAILFDVEGQTALRHIPLFLETKSKLEGLQISSQNCFILDSDLRVFKYDNFSFYQHIQCCKFAPNCTKFALNGRYIIGISENQRDILVVRTSDDKKVGSMFVHGKATCLRVADDDRTVIVGCEDGRIMILSLILEMADPLREHIEKLPSRSEEPVQNNLIINDVHRLSLSTPDQQRLSARLRKASIAEERRPPSYTTLHRAVTISRMSSRERSPNACAQQ
ncbi:NACHT and WD repeat domain-containing protein 2-like [Mercenaria mercenaria]|uniref:NACHT and WD repeat domain-containing protein 2-like n=1 Tax=Mercenaria mercenaria TaxID=6596 RepID=UPI00234F27B3|nr:NACHT and WD repeat domain-containing protein 2-like [Mercenaria mercenaria]